MLSMSSSQMAGDPAALLLDRRSGEARHRGSFIEHTDSFGNAINPASHDLRQFPLDRGHHPGGLPISFLAPPASMQVPVPQQGDRSLRGIVSPAAAMHLPTGYDLGVPASGILSPSASYPPPLQHHGLMAYAVHTAPSTPLLLPTSPGVLPSPTGAPMQLYSAPPPPPGSAMYATRGQPQARVPSPGLVISQGGMRSPRAHTASNGMLGQQVRAPSPAASVRFSSAPAQRSLSPPPAVRRHDGFGGATTTIHAPLALPLSSTYPGVVVHGGGRDGAALGTSYGVVESVSFGAQQEYGGGGHALGGEHGIGPEVGGSGGHSPGRFADAVHKITAKALREYKAHHRRSLEGGVVDPSLRA